jgi:CRP-like cAMP-binding protein
MTGEMFDSLLLFADLTPEQRELLEPIFHMFHAPAGSVLFHQADPAEILFLCVDGEVQIRFKPEDGPEMLVTRIRSGGVVGWSAALGSPVYTSSAICVEDSWLVQLRGSDLRQLCEKHPDTGALVLERLAAAVAERLRSAHHHVMALLEQGVRVHIDSTIG